MLRTPSDLWSALAGLEYTEPNAALTVPEPPNGLHRTALFVFAPGRDRSRARGGHALDELGGGGTARKLARRVLVLGVGPAEPGRESERVAQERAGTCVHIQWRSVGRAKALVEDEVELTKTEGGWEKGEGSRCAAGKASRRLERGERRLSQKIGRLSVRQLPAYKHKER
jgi:hypothetical protein